MPPTFSGTDTSSGQGGITTVPEEETSWFWSLPHAQAQTQPVVREGLEHLLTGNLLVLKLMYLERSSWMTPIVSEVQIHTPVRDGIQKLIS
jgi:hypothetical protein